ncbi:hypothetical protein SDC9_208207 [bioreactor metagenome]|uniref:Uncharacterized protein n=1 Tax=bioreactor metagenome TaxID=1076179 RepID=A0A645JCK5_9ZZZZ
MVIGNRDGVAVVAQEKIESVLLAAEAIAIKEEGIVAELRKGRTTIDIYQFPKLISKQEG